MKTTDELYSIYDSCGIIVQISFYDKNKWGWDIIMQDTGLSINADARFYDWDMVDNYFPSRKIAETTAFSKAKQIKERFNL